MAEKIIGKKIITPRFRVAFSHVFEPTENQQGKKVYEITMLFDKGTDLNEIRREINGVAAEKWGKIVPPSFRKAIKDGDLPNSNGNIYDGFENHFVIRAWSYNRPQIIDSRKNVIDSSREFYSGCYARASIVAFPYNNTGNCGVGFFLNNIQKLADGEKFGGGSTAQDDFDEVEVEVEVENSSGMHDGGQFD